MYKDLALNNQEWLMCHKSKLYFEYIIFFIFISIFLIYN